MARTPLLLMLTLILIQGCSGQTPASVAGFEDTIPLDEVGSILIEIDSGTLYVRPTEAEDLFVSGELADLGSLEIDRSSSGVEIDLVDNRPSDTVQVKVPGAIALNIKTFSADVVVEGFSGELIINSSAGNLLITGFSGLATIWAGRGETAVSDSRGEMTLISEHGAVGVERFSGEISMSTIMGSLTYSGIGNDNNVVRIEADHGPVTAILPASANASITAATTSGDKACIGPGIQHTVDGCQANLGTGAASVVIRTVSGRIEVRIVGVPEN